MFGKHLSLEKSECSEHFSNQVILFHNEIKLNIPFSSQCQISL